MNDKTTKENLTETILQITSQKKPETVNQLIELTKQAHPYSTEQILNIITTLQSEGKLKLTAKPPQQPPETSAYLKTSAARWYWITVAFTITATAVVFTVPEDLFPFAYVRNVLGALFILFLPGYTFLKALFPKQAPAKTNEREMDIVEQIALSIGMSLALVALTGLLLNYTPWGIRLTPITLSLTALTLAFATAAVIRKHQTPLSQQPQAAHT